MSRMSDYIIEHYDYEEYHEPIIQETYEDWLISNLEEYYKELARYWDEQYEQ